MRVTRWPLFAMALLLAACQQLPQLPASATTFDDSTHTSGRLAVRVEGKDERSFSANFELAGGPRAGLLALSTPLGTRMAQAQWQPGRAWLSSGEGVQEFAELDSLAQQALGERVPLAALFDWLAGRPWPGADSHPLPAPAQGFEQLGWEVRLDRWADRLVVATRRQAPVVTVRAKLDALPPPTRP